MAGEDGGSRRNLDEQITVAVVITCIVAASGGLIFGYDIGISAVNGAAQNAAPVYLSEVAPPKWRGAFNSGFQLFIGLGVVIANCINYATAKQPWGWRLSLGLAAAPATIMTVGLLIIPDTPSSLLERGKIEEAEKSLRKARGEDVDVRGELAQLMKATQLANAAIEEPFVTILERQHRPHLVLAVLIPLFQQVTGINVIAFYAPVLFQSVGFGSDSALIASIILGLVNLGSTLVSSFLVDRFGRRFLFLEGGVQMFIFQIAIAGVLATTTGATGTEHMSKSNAIIVLILMCIYAAGFGWSWGPLTLLVPSEIFPLKIRPTGQSISVAVNFAFTFLLSQTFLALLCRFKFGAFFFYAGCIAIMTIFVALFVPETKGIPLDSMHVVWKQHWYWHRFVKEEEA
ncbi:Sugar transport protein 5 [Bienertia sinuspersici]